MKHQTKERNRAEATLSPKLSLLGLGTTVISKEFLAHVTLPPFQHKPGYSGRPKWSVLRCRVMWPYGFM